MQPWFSRFARNLSIAIALGPLVCGSLCEAATFMVRRTADSGPNTLRTAIERANANPGDDLIEFHLGGHPPYIIALRSPLPDITEWVGIDGTTQNGYAGRPLIEIDGSAAGAGANGLTIRADFVRVLALAIYSFDGNGIDIASSGNTILGNYLGIDPRSRAAGNNVGINLSGTAQLNFIGGWGAERDRNVISANRDA